MIDRIQIESKAEGGKLTRNRNKITQAVNHFEGKNVVVTIERKRSKRSNEQNAYLWGVCYPIIASGMADIGTPISKEGVHVMMRLKAGEDLPNVIYEDAVNKETGEVIARRMRSTTEYTTSQMMEYIEAIHAFAAEYLGVVIPDPDQQLEIGNDGVE